jgi:transposase
MEVRILRDQGMSLRAIAREVGVSVNTVRKYLASDEPPGYRPRPVRPGKLAAFEAYLRERVAAAHPAWIPATVLYREVKERGFAGCERLVSRFVKTLKPAKPEDPVVRFETEPGRQLQVDWIEFRRERLAAFVATLGHSRASFVRYVTDERIETLVACHIAAFEFFGGVPREVLYDNAKTVVIERDAYGPGQHRFHATLWDLAKHYGFAPRLCRPYRARTKGKVERFNRYLRHSFHVPLVSRLKQSGLRLDCQTANFEVLRWLTEVANVRVHGEIGRVPAQVLIEERAALQLLPPTPYRGELRRARPRRSEPAVPGNSVVLALPAKAQLSIPAQHDLSVYDALIAEAA